MKLAGCVFIVFIAITISGNVSVYPGETTTFTCKLNTQGIDGVTFQWVKLNGTNVTFFNENLDTEASGVGSTQNYNFTGQHLQCHERELLRQQHWVLLQCIRLHCKYDCIFNR